VTSSSSLGNYRVRLDLVRGRLLEVDGSYGNDALGQANGVSLVQSNNHRLAGVAGLVMAPEGANFDEDLYAWGCSTRAT